MNSWICHCRNPNIIIINITKIITHFQDKHDIVYSLFQTIYKTCVITPRPIAFLRFGAHFKNREDAYVSISAFEN